MFTLFPLNWELFSWCWILLPSHSVLSPFICLLTSWYSVIIYSRWKPSYVEPQSLLTSFSAYSILSGAIFIKCAYFFIPFCAFLRVNFVRNKRFLALVRRNYCPAISSCNIRARQSRITKCYITGMLSITQRKLRRKGGMVLKTEAFCCRWRQFFYFQCFQGEN